MSRYLLSYPSTSLSYLAVLNAHRMSSSVAPCLNADFLKTILMSIFLVYYTSIAITKPLLFPHRLFYGLCQLVIATSFCSPQYTVCIVYISQELLSRKAFFNCTRDSAGTTGLKSTGFWAMLKKSLFEDYFCQKKVTI